MENEHGNQSADLKEILAEQLEVLLAMLLRPVVQRQLLAVCLILLVAWLLPEGIRRHRRRRGLSSEHADDPGILRRWPWLAALAPLATPLVALLLLTITISLFARLGYTNGLLQDATNVIWWWLIYRGLQGLLHYRYGESAAPYQNRIIRPLFVLLVSLKILATLPGASALRDVMIRLGTISFSLIGLMTALLVLYLFAVAAWLVKDIMVRTLPARLHSDPGRVESVAALTRYSLLALGIIVSLGILGLDFTSLAIIAGGLSVGIGIGLQDTVANFVSGLVLLFEQSLRPGDVIELDNRISRVERISLRATTVRTRANAELTIPNASFTTGAVKNLTKSVPRMKLRVPFGVSYSSDLEKVKKLAVDIALQHPLTMAYPPPTLIVRNLGDSGLDLDLSVSIDRPELSFSIRSDLYIAFRKAFSEHDIEIPFAQIDLNLREGWEKVTSSLHTNWPLEQVDELPTVESTEEES